MPTIAELIVYDVPHINRIDGTPCKVVPCPYCRKLHRLPANTKSIVTALCPPHDAATFEERGRPDYWHLIHGGPAVRPVVLLLDTGDDMTADLDLLGKLQPREMLLEQTIPGDPTTLPDPYPDDLAEQKAMGDSFVKVLDDMDARRRKAAWDAERENDD